MTPLLILKALLPLAIIVAGLIGLFWSLAPGKRYVWDEHNPFRRFCKRCGQRQEQHRNALGADTWEAMGTLRDPKCRCHADTPHPQP